MAQTDRSLSRDGARAFGHFRPLLDLTHGLTDDRALKSQVLDERLAPGSELTLRVGWNVRQRCQSVRLRQVLHRFPDERLFRPELPENRDLVYASRFGEAAG